MADNQPNRQATSTPPEAGDLSVRSPAQRVDASGGHSSSRSSDSAGPEESISRQNITLMKRIRARDDSALAELYDRYSRSVYAIARQILWQVSDAEEVVEDTFWEVWRKADRYDPSRGSVVSYLLLLARSRAIDRGRQVRSLENSRGQMQSIDEHVVQASDEAELGPDDDILQIERRKHVRKVLAKLPKEQREAIELNFLRGLSHQQIAHALDTPLGTVKTRIRQGLIQLYDQLRNTDGGTAL